MGWQKTSHQRSQLERQKGKNKAKQRHKSNWRRVQLVHKSNFIKIKLQIEYLDAI